MAETLLSSSNVLLFGRLVQDLNVQPTKDNPTHSPFQQPRSGTSGDVQNQLMAADAQFARIYGFSFENVYYDLPKPVLFLVHGEGLPVSEAHPVAAVGAARPEPHRARAPAEPSLTGVGETDFQFADDIMVWSYDKADYTIRMDVETGMFEDILLNAVLGNGGDGLDARGMNARGMNARGMNVRGMNARGMNARGGGGD